jgi:hypothetical protein
LIVACDCEASSTVERPTVLDEAPPIDGVAEPPLFETVSPDDPRLAANPVLLERLMGSPHGYFRFVNIPFSQAVCRRFENRLRFMPTVNLHGDAHLEQYAVSDVGVGLSDFDDSSFGPGVLDLVRFGGSIYLAAHQHDWEGWESAFSAFLEGYRAALRDPDAPRTEPAFAARAREDFQTDRRRFLAWVEDAMQPIENAAPFEAGYRRYRELMLAENVDLPTTFFDVKRAGAFTMGVGSALDEKYLVRIEGATDADLDDVVLEYKEVRDLSGIDCIEGNSGGGAFRILVAQSRIGSAPSRFLAQVPRGPGDPPGARPYWVHEWLANYEELDVNESLTSMEDLREIAHDVGLQLGRGHTRAIASPLDSQHRRAQLAMVDELEDAMTRTIVDLSERAVESWEEFGTEIGRSQPPP